MLAIDYQTTCLYNNMPLFLGPKKEVVSIIMTYLNVSHLQKYFRLLLFRYLSSKMSKSGALMKMEQIDNIVHDLISMPQIRIDSEMNQRKVS